MINLTCSVDRKLMRAEGWSFILSTVDARTLNDGTVDPQRTYVTVYDSGTSQRALADERLRADDLARETGFDPGIGGYQLVLSQMGNIFVNLHLGSEADAWLSELDRLLESTTLFINLDVGSELHWRHQSTLNEWFKGEATSRDVPLFAGKLPEWSIVKRVIP